ncbi:hypothetical protein BDB01DRAFT_831287 [Pilobolus umbonatus]|nr:hypothetical protein BDB01DRAFT_831287 [Pilobolus umbonatus]
MYSQHYNTVDSSSNIYTQPHHYQHHPIPNIYQQHKEPLPSATDAKPSIILSINELADFSSTMVYLMWHARRQSVMDLHSSSKAGEGISNNNPEQTRVTANAANMTSAAFKKFCRQILNATQLSESVVLLALKYIAMLLQNNPNIQGADGSEYRLFTVALMLGNKFLDDNTFTNKTWSEVSGMKVTDLNIMELEFLDVLRFKLSIRKEEYERWRTALFKFRDQLINVPIEDSRQKLMETMALSVNQQQWLLQQQTSYSHQQQKSTIAHNSHLFSKPQYQFPIQTNLNGPINRVQLRIPRNPIYNQSVQSTPSVPLTTITPTMYDNSNQLVPTHMNAGTPKVVSHYNSNTNRRPIGQDVNNYAPYHTQVQPRLATPNTISQMTSATTSTPTTNIYPQSQSSLYTSTPVQPYSQQRPYPSTHIGPRGSSRTSSLSQSGAVEMVMKNGPFYHSTPPSVNMNINGNVMGYTAIQGSPRQNYPASYYMENTADYNPYVAAKSTVYKPQQQQQQQQQRPLPMTPSGDSMVTQSHDIHLPQKKYSGPTPEDPLTAVESYRVNY